MNADIAAAKHKIRVQVWENLDATSSVIGGSCKWKIPNFRGAAEAAATLTSLDYWRSARTVKSNPDKAQRAVRESAVRLGKHLYMAVPKLADVRPFYLVDDVEAAADLEFAARHAEKLGLKQLSPIDIAICGSVAVNREGVRIGKGAGYADIELALLSEAGLLTNQTLIVTTVHDHQVFDAELPEAPHDFRVDVIVTPHEVIRCPEGKRPAGIDWARLDVEKVAAIPLLTRLRHERDRADRERPQSSE